ncbi:MAG: PTS sugar transporter subunit IIA [Deltaproteobacteria bacterium]|nr:PTS sugar transporter subunit IIA [Deltaproteobacteria bacterium]
MEQDKVFTTQELAEYLKLNEKTIIKMAQSGHLPGVKIGNQWRFHLKAIDNFLLRDLSKVPEEELDSVIKTDVDIIPLSRLTNHNLIELDLKAMDVEAVLERLTKIAHREGLTSSQEKLLGELKKREEFLSTAIGNSIAIPHVRHPSPDLFRESKMIILLSKKGIDCDAPDNRPVHIFFMPCAPNEQIHIRLLARISKFFHMPGVVEKLMQVETKDKVIQILLRFDREYMYAGNKI